MNYKIYSPEEILQATVELPLSKSVSNRALIITALTEDGCRPVGLAECSDTRVMLQALDHEPLEGQEEVINVSDAGTAMRFLTAYFAATPGRTVTIDGNDRMRQRPISVLVDALRQLGAEIFYLGEEGFPPLKICGKRLAGGDINVDSTVSSQFVSALMMIAPTMTTGLSIRLVGEVASLPYIDLTISMMLRAGIDAERCGDTIIIAPGKYLPTELKAERDWSAASFWYEIVALTGGFVTLSGLDLDSMQPDRRNIELFESMGVETSEAEETVGVDLCGAPDVAPRLNVDLSSTPDIAPALIVTCAMVGVPFRVTGLQSLKIKECDRLEALSIELRKIGVVAEIEGGHSMTWNGRRFPIAEMPVFETYGDHRMAMAFAPVAAYLSGIVIKDVEVVAKSYPAFWDDLAAAGFRIVDADSSDDTDGQMYNDEE